eukprot:gene4783-5134_t
MIRSDDSCGQIQCQKEERAKDFDVKASVSSFQKGSKGVVRRDISSDKRLSSSFETISDLTKLLGSNSSID